jgi:hypothetical protein
MARTLAELIAISKSGISGKDYVKQQKQAEVRKILQTSPYQSTGEKLGAVSARLGNEFARKYLETTAPKPAPQPTPTVVVQPQQQTQAPVTTTPATTTAPETTAATTDGGDGAGGVRGGSGGGGGAPAAEPTIDYQKMFDDQLAAMRDQLAKQAAEQQRAYQLMISQFQTAQQQAAKDAERQRRQMQIAQAYGQSDPADVRFSRSRAQRAGMVSAGTSGAFGRKGLRIRNLNISDKSATSNNQAGSFA